MKSFQQISLFKDIIECPETEGIKYIGSKLKILPYIIRLVQGLHFETVLDGFAGTTRASQAFSKLGYKVICNDVAIWSKVFGLCYLKNKKTEKYYQDIIDYLNSLEGKDGWFTEHYGSRADKISTLKRPWQIHNTRKLDAIREAIDEMHLPEIEKSVLVTSLILALDKVDSTLGHYASYLKNWAPRSYNTMILKVPAFIQPLQENEVLQADIFDIIKRFNVDLAYFDPPYGSNNEKMPPSRVRYAAYYHIWATICLNDKPRLFGKTNRRFDSSDTLSPSIFESYKKDVDGKFLVTKAIEKLLVETNTRYILLSYSSGGRISPSELEDAIKKAGRLITFEKITYKKNVMTNMRWTNEWVKEVQKPNQEFLFLIEKK